MRRLFQLTVASLAVLGLCHAGEVLDRIVAVVNNRPIFQSQLEEALRFEALQDGKSPDQLSAGERKAELDRLIDQELIRQQMRDYGVAAPPEAEVQKQVEEVRKQVPGAQTDTGWQAALDRSGLSPEDVTDQVRTQLEILRALDVRLRPTIRVDRSMVSAYYREKYLPELRRSGAKDVPMAQVYSQIQEILIQQGMEKAIDYWLKTLREQSDIHIGAPSLTDSRPPGNGKR
ncbi:MAG TPA: SurA N-terminal domain-containing protein [Terriglobales bacterium]|nr:SurA N-terminal domain-containing protein [Terriglobales bacterium]